MLTSENNNRVTQNFKRRIFVWMHARYMKNKWQTNHQYDLIHCLQLMNTMYITVHEQNVQGLCLWKHEKSVVHTSWCYSVPLKNDITCWKLKARFRGNKNKQPFQWHTIKPITHICIRNYSDEYLNKGDVMFPLAVSSSSFVFVSADYR